MNVLTKKLGFSDGFTLAELLSALAILGIIATFTIPKVLNGVASGQNNATAKELMATISQAYQLYRLENTVKTGSYGVGFNGRDLVPYLNYVSVDTSSQIDKPFASGTPLNCVPSACYKLHNGGILYINNSTFLAPTSDHIVVFFYDPDGQFSSNTGSSAALEFFLYYDGGIRTYGTAKAANIENSGTFPAQPTYDPAWFSW